MTKSLLFFIISSSCVPWEMCRAHIYRHIESISYILWRICFLQCILVEIISEIKWCRAFRIKCFSLYYWSWKLEVGISCIRSLSIWWDSMNHWLVFINIYCLSINFDRENNTRRCKSNFTVISRLIAYYVNRCFIQKNVLCAVV